MQPTILGLPPDVEQLLGRGHLLVLHFPIALLLAAVLLEVINKLRRTGKPSPSALSCCLLGTLGALVTGLTGWLYAEYDPPGRSLEDTLFYHRWGAVAVASVATLSLLLGAVARKGGRPRATGWYRATLLLAAGGVAYVGHLGGNMVHGEDYFDVLGTRPTPADTTTASLAETTPATPASSEGQLTATPAGAPPAVTSPVVAAAATFDFAGLVMPIFEARCIECHGPTKRKGRLRLDAPDDVFKGAPAEWLVQPSRPGDSELLRLVELPEDDLDRMPGKGPALTSEQIRTLRDWIVAGAPWPERTGDETAAAPALDEPSATPPDAVPPAVPSAPPADEAHGGPVADDEPLIPAASEQDQQIEQAALSGLVARGALAAPVAAEQRAVEVDFGLLGSDVSDDDLALLAGLEPALVWLGLQGTAVTDDGLASLSGHTALRRLNLSRTAIGDGGLAHLAGLGQLESLNLYGTQVTDAGLPSLQGLSRLRRLYLWDTQVTAAGVQALRAALPEVDIDVGVGADALTDDLGEGDGDGG